MNLKAARQIVALLIVTIASKGSGLAQPKVGSGSAEASSVELATVLARMKHWESQIQSARFYYVEQEAVGKGFETDRSPDLRARLKGEPFPPKDKVLEKKAELFVSGNRRRYSYEGPIWSDKKGDYVQKQYVSSFDGDAGQFYFPPADQYGHSVIIKDRRLQDDDNYHIRPLVFKLRPSLYARIHKLDTYKRNDVPAIVDGRRCAVFDNRHSPFAGLVEAIWVDPALDYSIVRYVATSGEQVILQMNISYVKQDDTIGYLPDEWTITNRMIAPEGQKTSRAKVTRREINQPIEENEFRIVVAPGTVVTDLRANKEYIQKEQSKRYILPNEKGAMYDQLLNSSEGEALTQARSSTWPAKRVIVYVLFGFVFLVCAAVIIQIRKRMQHT